MPFRITDITDRQAADLLALMVDMEEPAPGDDHLYPTGPHRDLYHYLTRQMGLPVAAGRRAVWETGARLLLDYTAQKFGHLSHSSSV